MNSAPDFEKDARNFAADVLAKKKDRIEADIRLAATKASEAMCQLAKTLYQIDAVIDVDAITADLMHSFSVSGNLATALDDSKDHEPWDERRATISPRFWSRYRLFLEREEGFPRDVIDKNIDNVTDMVLQRIEDPQRVGAWDRRGMVVGSVQSGKTANYIGLVNKALDAGYKLIIILAGIHSNLRSQTQIRVDEGVLGFDTERSQRLNQERIVVGVGKLPGDQLHVHPLTNSGEDGDFTGKMGQTASVMLGSDPVVLVMKKNSVVLKHLLNWVLGVAGTEDALGRVVVKNVPLLLIDDEADNASINTKTVKLGDDGREKESVTAINGRIRELLDKFEKSAYVGYTATPFANIFVNPDGKTEKHGKDIFPRSFIINVKAPSNYVGPAKIFGLDGDIDAGFPSVDGVPIIRPITDYGAPDLFPPKHKKDHYPARLPDTLKEALRSFVLACAARRARGQGKKHSSMLVHVTRFVDVQIRVVELVQDELDSIRGRLLDDGQRRPRLRDELKELWESDFVSTSKSMEADAGKSVSWGEVEAELLAAATKIAILPINGLAREALDYKEHEEEGRSVIAIGGDKLSRGLTLEGLIVSYFLRTTRMYDTLMQMGRWFGYRPGYLDLCRIYTTRTLITWYRHIALADAELRREFDRMVIEGRTPENYGLRVRTHPDGMIVTALNKMAHSERLELSWAGVLVQTTALSRDPMRVAGNLAVVDAFLKSLPKAPQDKNKGSVVWRDVPGDTVAGLVGNIQFPPESSGAGCRQLADFIRKQGRQGELSNWTVALIGVPSSTLSYSFAQAGINIGPTSRGEAGSPSMDVFTLKNSNIIDPSHQSLDLKGQQLTPGWIAGLLQKQSLQGDHDWLSSQVGKNAWETAIELSKRWAERKLLKTASDDYPNGRIAREIREKSRGLLLVYPIVPKNDAAATSPMIGIAISFPTSDTATFVEYRVNTIWSAAMEDDEEYED